MDLGAQMGAILQGGQAGDTASMGMVPNASQSQGSPQMNNPAIGMIRAQVFELSKIQAELFRSGANDPEIQGCLRELMDITAKLQGVANKLDSNMRDKAMQAAQPSMMQPPY